VKSTALSYESGGAGCESAVQSLGTTFPAAAASHHGVMTIQPGGPAAPEPTEPIEPIVEGTEHVALDSTSELPPAPPVDEDDFSLTWTADQEALRTPDTEPMAAFAAAAPATASGPAPVHPRSPAGARSPAGVARPGVFRRIGAWFGRVWSRTGGKVAILVIAGLAVFAIAAASAAAMFLGTHDRQGRFGDRAGSAACAQGGRGEDMNCQGGMNGQGRRGQGQGQGRQNGQGQGQGFGQGQAPGQGQGFGQGQGQGQAPGANGYQGLGGLGTLRDAVHGEVVIGGATPKTVLFQVGQVTDFKAGQSLTVKSSDGFSATYALTPTTTLPANGVASGASVRVIADKDGAKATRVALFTATTQ